MFEIIKDETWKATFKIDESRKCQFKLQHHDTIEIVFKDIEPDEEVTALSRKVLSEISQEIEKGKMKSQYESFVFLEDKSGQFLINVEIENGHNFTMKFMDHDADFSLMIRGHAFEMTRLAEVSKLIENM